MWLNGGGGPVGPARCGAGFVCEEGWSDGCSGCRRLSGVVRMSALWLSGRAGWRAAAVVVLAGVVVALSGCTPRPPVPSPTWSPPTVWVSAPTPTTTRPVSPSPLVSPSPTPTPSQSLYGEAVAVYRVFFDASAKMDIAGDSPTLPPEVADLLTGRALELVAGLTKFTYENGYHYVGDPQYQLVWVRPYVTELPADALVALETCEEISGAVVVDGKGTVLSGNDEFLSYQAFFQRDESQRLVIYRYRGGQVDSCPE